MRTKKSKPDDQQSESRKSSELILAEAVAEYVHDPLGYVYFCFPWGVEGTELSDSDGPRKWQADVLDSIGQQLRSGAKDIGKVIREAVASGHGIGKSALVSWIVKWAFDTFPGMRGRVTANTEAQLLNTTWPELTKWHNISLTKHWAVITATALFSADKSRAKNWRVDAVTWSVNNTEAFAGMHNKGKRLLLMFDEASGIERKVWEVANGALTDSDTEIIWCAFGNPTRASGYFFDCFNTLRHRWNTRNIDSRDVEGTNLIEAASIIEDNGIDSDYARIRVLGMFPTSGEEQFIPTGLVTKALLRQPSQDNLNYPIVIGVDVARHGTDTSCILVRQGRAVIAIDEFRIPDLMQIAYRVAAAIEKYQPSRTFIDVTGMGWGVFDRLRENKYKVTDIQVGETAYDERRYKIRRDELWGLCKEWLMDGACIPIDAKQLANELCQPQFYFSIKMQTQIESKENMKKRQLASPNVADALCLTFSMPTKLKDEGKPEKPKESWREKYRKQKVVSPWAA